MRFEIPSFLILPENHLGVLYFLCMNKLGEADELVIGEMTEQLHRAEFVGLLQEIRLRLADCDRNRPALAAARRREDPRVAERDMIAGLLQCGAAFMNQCVDLGAFERAQAGQRVEAASFLLLLVLAPPRG